MRLGKIDEIFTFLLGQEIMINEGSRLPRDDLDPAFPIPLISMVSIDAVANNGAEIVGFGGGGVAGAAGNGEDSEGDESDNDEEEEDEHREDERRRRGRLSRLETRVPNLRHW